MADHRGLAAAVGSGVGLAAVVLAVAGCGHRAGSDSGTGNASGNPSGNASGTWTVGLVGERSGPYERCQDDPVIDEAIQSADYPSSHLGIRLAASATAADARHIADCLQRNLKSGTVTVTGPARPQ